MTKDVFLALLTEEGLTVWEAGTFWEAQVKHFPENIEHLTVADVRALGREVFPASKRLRDLQRTRGATHRPDL